MDIKQIAVTKALKILDALGAKYKVILDDQEYGTLETVAPRKRGPYKRVNNYVKQLDYIDKVRALEPGDVLKFPFDTADEARRFQSALSGRAGQIFGKGTCMTTVNGTTAELMRVE